MHNNQQALIQTLQDLPDEQLLAVLQAVFDNKRRPQTDSVTQQEEVYFLGLATREHVSPPSTLAELEPWQLSAVAYIDQTIYGEESYGPDWGFCQFGRCTSCNTLVRSNIKQGICPLCYTPVYLS